MDSQVFADMKRSFERADTQGKIDIYVKAEGLSREQYRELLQVFPLKELNRLEEALG